MSKLSSQQLLAGSYLRKIDPALWSLVLPENVAFAPTIVDSTSVEIDGTKYYHVKVISTNAGGLAVRYHFHFGSVWPTFATAWLSADQIDFLAQQEDITYIEAPIKINLLNDFTRATSGAALLQAGGLANTVFDGSGTIVAVVDAGVDWQHGDFISTSSSTSSRILSLWDQTLTVTGSEKTPYDNDATLMSCCNSGVEYLQSEIDAELASSSGSIRNASTSNHGSHVLGTAAGNGNSLSSAQHIGMAPSADILFVNTDFSDAGIIDALSYLSKKADDAGKPIVVNMSLGSDYCPHDGTSLLAQAVNSFTGTGKVVVCAAGNEGASNLHISGTIAEGGSTTFDVTVPSYTANSGASNDYFEITLWLRNADSVTASVTGPNGSVTSVTVGGSTGVNTASDGAVIIDNAVSSSNGDRYINFTIFDYVSTNPPATGTYTITLNNVNANPPYSRSSIYHAWLYAATVGSLASGDNSYIVSSPASASSAIAVGSYVHKWRWQNYSGSAYSYSGTDLSDNISSFSSSGPDRYGNTKPNLTAPGQGVSSTWNSNSTAGTKRIQPGQKHYLNQGTSMASPAVAGAAALLLQYNSSLSASQIKDLLTGSCFTDAYTGSVPNNTWGYGKLDVFSAMVKAINSSASPSRQIIAYDDWLASTSVALSGSNKVALKFETGGSGTLSSVLFHTGSSSNTLTGNIEFAILDDNSGVPGTQIGSSFYYDYNKALSYTWQQALNSSSISLSASSTYYVVITLAQSADSWSLLAENNSVDNRSYVYSSGSWYQQSGFDFRIRPVVLDGSGLSVLPVSFSHINVAWNERREAALLTWTTATELNNDHFDVERALSFGYAAGNLDWQQIAIVAGSGTQLKSSNYNFTDDKAGSLVELLKPDMIYYRLRQVDFDGIYSYSKMVALPATTSLAGGAITCWPNPVRNGQELNFTETGDYSIYNMQGGLVQQVVNSNKMSIGGYRQGIYMLKNKEGLVQLLVVE